MRLALLLLDIDSEERGKISQYYALIVDISELKYVRLSLVKPRYVTLNASKGCVDAVDV